MAVRPLFRFGEPSGNTLAAIRFLTDRASGSARKISHRTSAATLNGVPCTWVQAESAGAGETTVLHLHGGGFLVGSPRSHTALAVRLSAACDARVCLPDYRLSPEHPHPAGADDALATYRGLLAAGVDPAQLIVSGDSAGGHLAAALINDVIREGLPRPAAVVLLSPVIDPTSARAIARDRRRRDPVLAVPFWAPAVRAHFGGGGIRDQRTTPIDGVDRRWPPTFIQVGTRECLLDDARGFAAALKRVGVPCELQIWPGQIHVFQIFAGFVPEADDAIAEIGRFLHRTQRAV
ncbi:alpha/beta hydrolase [Nocardia huaxiensis]|uniref:alpha/beta hydrolase n=1 Tax=Nocardia huaxiensis TaxID=2755382 RepID=UPI001E359E48|nr:alpha/beta hydrolase [Nocardia huaxiensis]UFS97662.1 alpha/beta hydrolase [Nocardia huaxiensis]